MWPQKKKTISTTFSVGIFLTCLSFVLFQSHRCVKKYISNPKSTKITYEDSKTQLFPEFTICSDKINVNEFREPLPFNSTIFEKCQLTSHLNSETIKKPNECHFIGNTTILNYSIGANWIGNGKKRAPISLAHENQQTK